MRLYEESTQISKYRCYCCCFHCCVCERVCVRACSTDVLQKPWACTEKIQQLSCCSIYITLNLFVKLQKKLKKKKKRVCLQNCGQHPTDVSAGKITLNWSGKRTRFCKLIGMWDYKNNLTNKTQTVEETMQTSQQLAQEYIYKLWVVTVSDCRKTFFSPL